jgi:hypothetical protein
MASGLATRHEVEVFSDSPACGMAHRDVGGSETELADLEVGHELEHRPPGPVESRRSRW